MKYRRPHHRRRGIARAVGSASVLALALGVGMTPASAAGKTSDKPAATASPVGQPNPNTPWAPENDEQQLKPAHPEALASARTATSAQQLTMPAPTGRHSVGMVGLHLVDKSRTSTCPAASRAS
ncbi:hypothetical protein SALBM311S_11654 [Streptomyces alboniger]